MRKILIITYFGKFNEYFNLWLDSCEYNEDINWLIVTDNIIDNKPDNVKVINQTFDEFVQFIQSKFDFKINLKTPYKLCDYKAYYGYIFSEHIKEYDFWGYCDCDVIFGKISEFIDEDLFNQYDKLLRRGHLSFIRNKEEINNNFLKYDTYKMVLTSPVIYGYDESIYGYHNGFAGELLESIYRFYEDNNNIADIDFRNYGFNIIDSEDKNCIFSFKEGRLYKHYLNKNKIIKEEIMYVHFQKRKMLNKLVNTESKYIMLPNEFIKYNDNLLSDPNLYEQYISSNEDYHDYIKEKKENIKRDIMRFLYEPKKIDSLRYRFNR